MSALARRPRLALLLFITGVLLAGMAIGFVTRPGSWYATLTKPSFNPPNWVFGPVWSTLYVMIGIAGWRIWRTQRESAAMALWWTQLLLNWLWTPTFFVLHSPPLALAIVLSMLAVIVCFIAACWRRDRIAAWLFLPYALWVSFATVLNTAIVALN